MAQEMTMDIIDLLNSSSRYGPALPSLTTDADQVKCFATRNQMLF